MKKTLLAVLVIAGFASCKKEGDMFNGQVFKGAVEKFQHGKAWTWYETDKDRKPLRLAVAIDAEARNSLDPGSDHNGGHQHGNNVVLKFHPQAQGTPFNHIGLGWNPHGHEPEPIYGKPHFDFHFYLMTPEAVAAIPPYEVDSLKFKNWPAPAYFPPTYINPGGGVPMMGAHWVDITSSEFGGQPFTQTFIYGSYDGKVTFYEPMITEAFIKANPSFERSIPQPAKWQKSGYYPTKMRIATVNGITNIILEEFVYRNQS